MNHNPFFQAKQTPFSIRDYRCRYINTLFVTILLLWLFSSAAFAQSCPLYPSPHLRIGFNVTTVGGVSITDYDAPRLGAGWYHDYRFQTTAAHPGGIRYHQLVRGARRTTLAEIQKIFPNLERAVSANPGQLWLVVNEGDRHGQDSLTPQQYADFYYQIYNFIKQRDPSSRIAVGGIVQPTPLRLRYLDQVLSAYEQSYGQTLPADAWHIHNFILPENCGWGAGIPPGLEAYASEGTPCPPSLDEHGNLATIKQQLETFRTWMSSRGYRNYPLIVSEYGILLSQYHGYPHPRVRDFMLGSFDFMLNTTNSQTGYPADNNRLVQEFAWFSLNDHEFDLQTYRGLNGNLFDYASRQIMPLGLDFETYVKAKTVKQIDLAMRAISADPPQATSNLPVTLAASFVNLGSVAAQDVVVRFWHGDPRAGGRLLGTAPLQPQVLPECTATNQSAFVWTPTQLGVYTIFAELTAANSTLETDHANNYASLTLTVGDSAITATPTSSPTPSRTPTLLPTATSTILPTPTPSPVASATPNATTTAAPTVTATPTSPQTPTATTIATQTPVGALTATPTIATATPTPSATSTLLATATGSVTPLATATGVATTTPTATGSATATPTTTATPTATVTLAPDMSATPTPTEAALGTPTPTSVEATLTPPPTQTETPTATPTETPINTPTPTSTVVVIGGAPIKLDIDLAATTALAGEDIRYQFRYQNSSAQELAQLTLRVRVPAHTAFNPAASGADWLCDANQVECHLTIGELASGASGAAAFVVTSDAGLAHSQLVMLTVLVEDDQQVITTANATVTVVGARGFVQYLPFAPK